MNEHAEATRAGLVAAARMSARERAITKRAGQECPVCGWEIGANGLCWRSKACADVGLDLLLPYFDRGAFAGSGGRTAADVAREVRKREAEAQVSA